MALLFFDGFETYQTEDDMAVVRTSKGYTSNGILTYWGIGTGRRGGRGAYCTNTGGSGQQRFNFYDNYVTVITGFAIRQAQAGTPGYSNTSNGPILFFFDGSTIQMIVNGDDDELVVRRGDGTILGTTSGAGITYGIWRYLEVKVTIDSSSGVVEIRRDGNTILSLTGQNTQNSGNAYLNKVGITCLYSGLDTYFDDWYILDTSGSKNNDFLGDVRVDVIRPDGAGTYTQLTPSAGSNYENVDESYGPDDDTTYNEGSTPGNKDSYALGSLDVLGTTIHGVKSQITVKKTDAGSKNVKLLTISGTTEDLRETTSLSDSYTTEAKIFEDNPDDSSAWEEADVNAMEVGVQIVTTTTSSTTTTTTTTA